MFEAQTMLGIKLSDRDAEILNGEARRLQALNPHRPVTKSEAARSLWLLAIASQGDSQKAA